MQVISCTFSSVLNFADYQFWRIFSLTLTYCDHRWPWVDPKSLLNLLHSAAMQWLQSVSISVIMEIALCWLLWKCTKWQFLIPHIMTYLIHPIFQWLLHDWAVDTEWLKQICIRMSVCCLWLVIHWLDISGNLHMSCCAVVQYSHYATLEECPAWLWEQSHLQSNLHWGHLISVGWAGWCCLPL